MTEFAFGPIVSKDEVMFRLWAPDCPHIDLSIEGLPLRRMDVAEQGWHVCAVASIRPGALYKFILPDGLAVPDPASRFQPGDVHGPSEVVDLAAFQWKSTRWIGRPWEETVFYELHVGAFTNEGTFSAAIERLDHLRDLGITALQLMPIGDFPGHCGWGYDGVMPYAPESSYGRPEDLMALIDAAHARGISVFLDLVYNHFGPDGNYLAAYAPLFSDKHHTPWGNGINYDDEGSLFIREFVIQNALYWLEMFRVDGFRLDAVHAIRDDSAEHLLDELARRVTSAAGGRHVHLVIENEDNDSTLLRRDGDGRPERFTAQWDDDIHHVLHVAATGEDFAYYADYQSGPHSIGQALAEGFVYQGEFMPYRGEARGQPSAHLPPTAFISFIQNHDQIGNRANGDRMAASQSREVLKAIAAVYLLAPQIPMLFMGEEWGAEQPFPYFCDFDEELNEKVRQGRRKELSRLPGFDAGEALDPTARTTFQTAKIDWTLGTAQKEILDFYRRLLDIRHAEIVPRLKGIEGGSGSYEPQRPWVEAAWTMGDGCRLRLLANLSAEVVPCTIEYEGPTVFELGSVDDGRLGPWSVRWRILG